MAFPVAALLHTLKLSHVVSILYQLSAFFFALCLHARLKLESPVCFLNRSHLKNRTHFMPFAKAAWSSKKKVCLVSLSHVQHTTSAGHNTNLIVLPPSTEISSSNNTGCWIRVISVFCQVSFHKAGHISLQKIITLPSFPPQCLASHRLGIWVTVHCTLLDYH